MDKMLSVVWFKIYPPHFGGQKGIALFNKHLSDRFEVDCLCSKNNERTKDAGCDVIPELPVSKWQFLNWFAYSRIKRQLSTTDYKWIIVEQPFYALFLQWLKKKNTKLIVHTHNIEALRFKSFNYKTWRLLLLYERLVLPKADLVLFKTKRELSWAMKRYKLQKQRCYVLPYGVEPADNNPTETQRGRDFLEDKHDISPGTSILLFTGTLDYQPNADAVEWIYKDLEPALRQTSLKFKILICGRNKFLSYAYLKELKNENIVQVGFVDEIDLYFRGADAFINPVRNIHGIQTKILDALNYNLNIVCFEKAVDELPDYLKPKLFVSPIDNLAKFVELVSKAIESRIDTPIRFYKDYSWKNIVANFAMHLQH
jgi:glycosyltransferase involved in cell wall biosynthesis